MLACLLLGSFSAGDVLLGDALYCNYFLIARLQEAGVDVLFEQNGSRITDFRRGRSLGPRDHLVRWPKPPARPAWMSVEQYHAFPKELLVREAKVHGQVLVTTMLKARKVSKNELGALYARRWNVELDIRNIKTTLGIEVLRCLTPQMVEKELWVCLLAYNTDPSADGPGGAARRRSSARAQLQAHGAAVEQLVSSSR